MRKFAILATAALFAAGVAACGSSSKSASSDTTTTVAGATSTTASSTPTTLAKIDCNGTSAYVTDIGTPPTSNRSRADTLTVVTSLPGPGSWRAATPTRRRSRPATSTTSPRRCSRQFGLSKLVIRNENFDAITAGTVTNYDVALSQITITCDRAKVVKFSIPYFAVEPGHPREQGRHDRDARRREEGAVGRADEHHRDRPARQRSSPTRTRRSSSTLSDAYAALQAKQVDAVLIDTAINLGEAAQSNGKFVVVGSSPIPGGPDQYGAHPAQGLDQRARRSMRCSRARRLRSARASSPQTDLDGRPGHAFRSSTCRSPESDR